MMHNLVTKTSHSTSNITGLLEIAEGCHMAIGEHTSKQYDAELESVRASVLQMGELVVNQVRLAIEALIKGDVALMDRIIADDHRVNSSYVTSYHS